MGRWRETWEREGEARGCEIVCGRGEGDGYRGGKGIE